MLKKLDRYQAESYALLRIVAGFLFSFHGAQKLLGWFAEGTVPFGTQMWLAGVIELAGGVLIMLGLFAREAAFVASGEMAVAYLQFHWRGQFGNQFFPIVNHGEMAVLYSFIFLLIATRGSGKWAVGR
jgi:putative oxidoreductase